MKTCLGLVGLFLALGLVYGEPPNEEKKLFDECEKEIGIIPTGPTNFDDPKIKCFAACMMKKSKLLADGKIDVEKTVEYIEKHFPGNASEADMTECANKANEEKDECEVSGAYQKCLMEKGPH